MIDATTRQAQLLWVRLRIIWRMKLRSLLTLLLPMLNAAIALAAEPTALYLGNEAVMVSRGETKILFDPLFRNTYGQYQSVPADMEAALFAAKPPFDGIDAVFISHYHEDHFSPALILELLKKQDQLRLFAPAQAVEALQQVSEDTDGKVLERVTPVHLEYLDPPVTLQMDNLIIGAVRIPHSGWPNGRLDVQNIAFRVTLDDQTTVLHMGDADSRLQHFANDPGYWQEQHMHMAFPPYWFFQSVEGREILNSRLKPAHSVGVHVPVKVPDEPSERPPEYQGFDLFTEPGETRSIPHSVNHDSK